MEINKKEIKNIFNNIKNGDKNAVEELYKKYNRLVYGIAFSILKNKEDSEDITQNVFKKIYEINKNTLPQNSEGAWIYAVTKNEALQLLRKKKDLVDLDTIYYLKADNNEIDETINKNEFNKLINKLNEKEKAIVSLKIISNFSFKEIAIIYGESISTIKWRYYNALYKLKIIISNISIAVISFIVGYKYSNKTNSKKGIESNSNGLNENEIEEITNTEKTNERADIEKKSETKSSYEKELDILNKIQTQNSVGNTNTIKEEQTKLYEDNQKENINIGTIAFFVSLVLIIITTFIIIKKILTNNKIKASK